MTSLFAAAKTAAPTTKKTKEKAQVELPPEERELLSAYNAACVDFDNAEAQKTVLHGMVLEHGRAAFLKLFKQNGSYPGSFKLVSGDAGVMIVPTDRYTKVDSDRAKVLTNKYGPEIVTETTKFAFNPIVLEKYQQEIEKMIMDCTAIPMEDKMMLVVADTAITVTKGSIERLMTFPSPEQALMDLSPIIQVKNV